MFRGTSCSLWAPTIQTWGNEIRYVEGRVARPPFDDFRYDKYSETRSTSRYKHISLEDRYQSRY